MRLRTTHTTSRRPLVPNATLDPHTRLADVLVGMNTKQSPQTLMVRPVSTTTLTFDGESGKFELIEDLFHTMFKMLPEKTKTINNSHFHSLLRKQRTTHFPQHQLCQSADVGGRTSGHQTKVCQTRKLGNCQAQMAQTIV